MRTRTDVDALAVALTLLAETMPDDPYRLEGVHARVRRLRARRRARGAAVGVVAAAAAVMSLVAVRSGPDRIRSAAATDPSTESTLPACHAALAPAHVKTPSGVSADRRGVKGHGTIVGTPTERSVTIHVDEPATDQPSELTAAVTDQTEFVDAGVTAPRPALAPDDRVVFAVAEAGGGYELLLLDVDPVETSDPNATQAVTDAVKAAKAQTDAHAGKAPAVQAEVGDPSKFTTSAEVVAVQTGTLTLKLNDGQVVNAATGADTSFRAGDAPCSGADLAAGDVVEVGLTPGTDGSYTAISVVLSD